MTYINVPPSYASQHCLGSCSLPCSLAAWDRGAPPLCQLDMGLMVEIALCSHTWAGRSGEESWHIPPLRGERQRCCELLSAAVALHLPLASHFGQHPWTHPQGMENRDDRQGQEFSLTQGCLCKRCDAALEISQRKLCFAGNMTKNFSHLWTLFTSELHPPPFLKKISSPWVPQGLCCCLQWGLISALLWSLYKTSLYHDFGRINTHHSFRSQIYKLHLEMQFLV